MSASPALYAELSRTHIALTLIVFVAPQIVAIVAEPPLLLWARHAIGRGRGRLCLPAALWAMALSFVACAASPTALLFGVAYSIFGTAVGVAAALAQTALVERNPDDAERAMARWTFAGVVGDLVAPLVLYACERSLGWRGAMAAVAALVGAWSLPFLRVAGPSRVEPDDEPSEAVPLRTVLARAGHRPRLFAWLAAAALSSLMDETLFVFGALDVSARFPNPSARWGAEGAVTLTLVALALGSALGLVVLDRALRRIAPGALLVVACVGSSVAFVAWMFAPTVEIAALLLALVGAFATWVYPLAKAQAYRALPGEGAFVNAAAGLFAPIDLLVPLGLGAMADALGLRAALFVLLVQPLGVLAITLIARPTPPQPTRPEGHGRRGEPSTVQP